VCNPGGSQPGVAGAPGRACIASRTVLLVCGDAQHLPLGDGTCDAGLLNLIVSVAPDGAACVREAVRVIRPDRDLRQVPT